MAGRTAPLTTMDGRSARALGRGDAGRRFHEFHEQAGVSRIGRTAASRGAVHARRCERRSAYRFTAEDPDTWTRPWTAFISDDADQRSDARIRCHEGNFRSMEGLFRGGTMTRTLGLLGLAVALIGLSTGVVRAGSSHDLARRLALGDWPQYANDVRGTKLTRRSIRSTRRNFNASSKWRGASRPTSSARGPSTSSEGTPLADQRRALRDRRHAAIGRRARRARPAS